MADYYPTLARAVSQLNTNSAEARLKLFERARTILRSHLCDGPESDLTRERTALECAIRKVEAEATLGGAVLSTSLPQDPSPSVTARTYGWDREGSPTPLQLRQHADTVSLTIASLPTSRVPTNRWGIPDPTRPVVAPDIFSMPLEDFEDADSTDNMYRMPSRPLRPDLGLGTGAYDDPGLDIRAQKRPGAYGKTATHAKVGKRRKLPSAGPSRPTAAGLGLVIMVLFLFIAFIGTELILSIANLPRLVWELERAPDHPQLLAVLVGAGSLVGILFFATCRGIPRSVFAAIDATGSVRLGIPWGKVGRSAGEFSDRQ